MTGIAHRDIKLQNVLLVECKKSVSGDYTLLMADFGLSRIIHHDDSGNIANNRTICGTPLFMVSITWLCAKWAQVFLLIINVSFFTQAPEILNRKPYNAFLVDSWALGVTIFIMMSLELPFDFKDQNKAVKDMLERKWNWPKDKMKAAPSADLKAITSGMLEPEPQKRLSMAQMCGHKWLADDFKKAQALANKK